MSANNREQLISEQIHNAKMLILKQKSDLELKKATINELESNLSVIENKLNCLPPVKELSLLSKKEFEDKIEEILNILEDNY